MPKELIPLIYFAAVVVGAIGMNYVGIPIEVTTMITGAGLMRVKIPAPPSKEKE